VHDRDTKFCREFRETLSAGGVKCLALAARSPNLNSYAERWVRLVKRGAPRLILFGEQSLRVRYRISLSTLINHQGRGNLLLFPTGTTASATQATAVRYHQRLGGLLKYYSRAA
jgi:putative transposase